MTRDATDYDREYDAGYSAFMLRCKYYASAHARMHGADAEPDDEAWTRYHNVGIDPKPVTKAYAEGYEAAQNRIARETRIGFGSMSPREMTKVHPQAAVRIPLKSEPEWPAYEAERVRRNAAFKDAASKRAVA